MQIIEESTKETREPVEGEAEALSPSGAGGFRKRLASRFVEVGLGIGLLVVVVLGVGLFERHRLFNRIAELENELSTAYQDRDAADSALQSEHERVAAIESLMAEIRVASKGMIANLASLDRLASNALLAARVDEVDGAGGELTGAVATASTGDRDSLAAGPASPVSSGPPDLGAKAD